MSQPATSAAVSGRAAADNRLHGRWLWLARIAWAAVTLMIVFLNILAFPDLYTSNFTFTSQMLQDLHRLGLSPTLYGWLITLMNFSFQAVYLPLGLLLFLRRSNERMALFCAFTLVTFGGGVPLFDFSSEVSSRRWQPIPSCVSLRSCCLQWARLRWWCSSISFPKDTLRRAGRAGPPCWSRATIWRWCSFRRCLLMPGGQPPT